MTTVMDDAADLVRLCATALIFGLDLETVWHTILRVHPLVAGARLYSTAPSAVIPLTTGDHLVVDAAGRVQLT